MIGTLLIAINQGDSLLGGELTFGRLVKVGLTYLVPYAVSTSARVGATLTARSRSEPPAA